MSKVSAMSNIRKCPVGIGDHVVHQSHPGRFTVTKIEDRPRMNVYSNILTIRSDDGVEMRVLDTVVRKLDPPAEEKAAQAEGQALAADQEPATDED
jgi:hypothetical protein